MDAVTDYLHTLGYMDITTCTSVQRGVDIEATCPNAKRCLATGPDTVVGGAGAMHVGVPCRS
jgi:hypothetical protein